MVLSIYQCDVCGEECSDWETRVNCNFPFGGTKHLCLKCANKIFGIDKDGEDKNESKTLYRT